jgi:hypothetical protein
MNAKKVSKEAWAEASTIGQHFDLAYQLSSHSLEDKIYTVSAGEYIYAPKWDNKYKHWPALFRFCREWVEAHREGPYVEYKTEADLMSWGMHQLAKLQSVAAPPPWMRTIRTLRELQKAQTRSTEAA